MKILGIDTSCDDTSVAIVENGNNVLSSVLSSSIDAHKEFQGAFIQCRQFGSGVRGDFFLEE